MVGVSGQPFSFGAVGGADDADRVPALHRQVILADFASHCHLGVVHGLLFTSHLESHFSPFQSSHSNRFIYLFFLNVLTIIVIPLYSLN